MIPLLGKSPRTPSSCSESTTRTDFWHAAIEALRKAGVALYANVSPSRDHGLTAGSGISGIWYSMIFNRDEVRVEFALGTRSKPRGLKSWLKPPL